MRNFVFVSVLLLFVTASVVNCQRWNSYGGKASGSSRNAPRNGGYYMDEEKERKPLEVNPSAKSHPVRRGGIGAWGYVAITLFVILSGLGVYYTIIFYPIVCKKQRMYHVMGSTTV